MSENEYPHEYVSADLGHNNLACKHCMGTPNENAAIGEANYCSVRHGMETKKPTTCLYCDNTVSKQGDLCMRCIDEQANSIEDDCPYCGGTGFDEDSCECEAFEDTCFCLNPTPRPCEHCR